MRARRKALAVVLALVAAVQAAPDSTPAAAVTASPKKEKQEWSEDCNPTEGHGQHLARGCSDVAADVVADAAEAIVGANHTAAVDQAESFFQAFGASFFVILATEVGDKTFFIAAVLAMRNSRSLVWSGAVGALAVMTVLAVALGWLAPKLLPPVVTHYAAVVLFVFFGGRMLYDSKDASSGVSDELAEVEEELTGEKVPMSEEEAIVTEEGGGAAQGKKAVPSAAADEDEDVLAVRRKTAASTNQLSTAAILLKAFSLTFVAEWGDRSQIATIALAASHEPIGVILGGVVGHGLCTGVAVIGGKLLATRISERMVLLVGGLLFFVFAILELVQGPGH